MKKETLWRAGIYGTGVFVLAMGASLGTKTGMGISPINAIPFACKSAFGVNFAVANFVFYAILILLQFLIRGKHRRWRDLLQLPFSAVFSFLLGLFDGLVQVPETLLPRLGILAASILLLGLGVTLVVNMNIVPNPADGMAQTMAWAMKKDLGLAKNILDFLCVSTACLIDLCFGKLWTSIGVSTVIAVIFIGRAVYLFNRLLKKKLLALAGLD